MKREPIKIKEGSVVVKIYICQRPDGYENFQVADYSTGKRRIVTFGDEDKAIAEARRIAKFISTGKVSALELGPTERASYGRAVELLRPSGVSLELAAATFAEAFQTNIGNVTTPMIQKFLYGLKLSPGSYTNFRRVIGTLFQFAKRKDYLPRDNDAIEKLEKMDGIDGEIETYTPGEMARLLNAASEDFLPSLAISAFSGLRSSEIERLDWQQVNLKRKFIVVKGARKRGTASRRTVPISDNLAAWLAPYAKQSGKVWPHTHDDFYDAQQETAAATVSEGLEGLKWKHNALRHSFISYRLSEVQNINQVALEAGNSPTTIHTHYKDLVDPEDAKRWFSMKPEASSEIVALTDERVA